MTLALVLGSVWIFGIPLALLAVFAACRFVDRRLDRREAARDRRSACIVLAFDPDRVPARGRHEP